MEKKQCLAKIPAIILFCIFVFLVITNFILPTKCQIDINICYKIIMFVIPLILQVLIVFLLFDASKLVIKENNKTDWIYAIAINILFTLQAATFVVKNKCLTDTVFQIASLVSTFFIILYISCKIEIDKESNLSVFKAVNYFMIALWTVIMLFIEKFGIVKCSVNVYYLAPSLMIQGLYELLENKKYK